MQVQSPVRADDPEPAGKDHGNWMTRPFDPENVNRGDILRAQPGLLDPFLTGLLFTSPIIGIAWAQSALDLAVQVMHA